MMIEIMDIEIAQQMRALANENHDLKKQQMLVKQAEIINNAVKEIIDMFNTVIKQTMKKAKCEVYPETISRQWAKNLFKYTALDCFPDWGMYFWTDPDIKHDEIDLFNIAWYKASEIMKQAGYTITITYKYSRGYSSLFQYKIIF